MKVVVCLAILCLPWTAAVAAEGYLDFDAVERILTDAGLDVRSTELGESREGRPIRSVLMGLPGPRPLEDRPRLLIVAGLEADHRVGTSVACSLIDRLSAGGIADAPEDHPLRVNAVEIVPLVNPDGLVALLAGPERVLRTNAAAVDLDRDGLTDEDGPRDLDGDGRITFIRVPRPGGSHGLSPDDPRLLVPAGPEAGIRGAFDLYPEGLDADGDGKIAEDGPGGVDLDRNFPHGWNLTDLETGRTCPSEPESRALADHLLATPRIACVLVLGRSENLVEVPRENRAGPRHAPDGPLHEDLPWLRRASELYREKTGAIGKASDRPSGAFHQWVYAQRGIPAFSTRVFQGPPAAESEKPPKSPDARWLAFSDELPDDAGFAPWRPYDHPTLGRVEIGGFAPLLKVNPPAAMLPELAKSHAEFVVGLLGLLPRPVLSEPTAKRLARGVYEIRATLRNEGVFPLFTAMGRKNRAPAPARLVIELRPEEILSRNRMTLIDRLDGYGGAREMVWIVRAEAKTRVHIRAVVQTWGTIEREVEL